MTEPRKLPPPGPPNIIIRTPGVIPVDWSWREGIATVLIVTVLVAVLIVFG